MNDDLFEVGIEVESRGDFKILQAIKGVDFGCRPNVKIMPSGRLRLSAFIPSAELPKLLGGNKHPATTRISLGRNVSAEGRKRQKEVLRSIPAAVRRFHGRLPIPFPFPHLPITSYLGQAAIDQQMIELAQEFPKLCELIVLPNRSVEGTAIRMLRIGTGDPSRVAGVLFSGCAHAREWGGAEICLSLATDLLDAYNYGSGLQYGAVTYTADDVRLVLTTYNVFIIPCLNPDGRTYSMQVDPTWRRNRDNPPVDLNRNYDFLWNFETAFDPSVANGNSMEYTTPASIDPGSDLYHGSAPASEPECQNVIWVFDTYPLITRHIDIHSFTGDVLWAWGDAPDQSTDPQMNFLNHNYDGKRGLNDPAIYAEYLSPGDKYIAQGASNHVASVIKSVRGQHYESVQSYYLTILQENNHLVYPVSGGVTDYAFSRHLVDPKKYKIVSLTIEFGVFPAVSDIPIEDFHPAFPEMGKIIQDVEAGLIAFCLFKFDPCGALQATYDGLNSALQLLESQVTAGVIPNPYTPKSVPKFNSSLSSLEAAVNQAKQALLQCRIDSQ